MITGFAHLYQQVRDNVAKARSVKTTGFIDQNELACVDNRAMQLCILDLILAAHREKYATNFNGLSGINALHHKLLIKYQWTLPQIREMSLSDLLLAIHDELRFENLEPEASRYFKSLSDTTYPVIFPDVLDQEWDPDLSAKFLTRISH